MYSIYARLNYKINILNKHILTKRFVENYENVVGCQEHIFSLGIMKEVSSYSNLKRVYFLTCLCTMKRDRKSQKSINLF